MPPSRSASGSTSQFGDCCALSQSKSSTCAEQTQAQGKRRAQRRACTVQLHARLGRAEQQPTRPCAALGCACWMCVRVLECLAPIVFLRVERSRLEGELERGREREPGRRNTADTRIRLPRPKEERARHVHTSIATLGGKTRPSPALAGKRASGRREAQGAAEESTGASLWLCDSPQPERCRRAYGAKRKAVQCSRMGCEAACR